MREERAVDLKSLEVEVEIGVDETGAPGVDVILGRIGRTNLFEGERPALRGDLVDRGETGAYLRPVFLEVSRAGEDSPEADDGDSLISAHVNGYPDVRAWSGGTFRSGARR